MTSALTSTYTTLLDWAKRNDPDGTVADIIEVLSASNPIIADANVMEGNLPTGHRSTQRVAQPSGTFRKINAGVPTEKGTTKQIDDTCGMLEGYSEIDKDLAILNGNSAAYMASEDNAFIAGFNSTVATAIFYSNSMLDPEKPHGLSPRYSALTSGGYDDQMINAGGSDGDNTSIWFITWGPKTCTLLFPKGSVAGLTSTDLGEATANDGSGNLHQVYRTHFQWKFGLALMDYRYVTRICNIDDSDLTATGATGADLLSLMVDAFYAKPTESYGDLAKTFIYCNPTIAKFLHKQAQNKGNVNLTIDNPAGQPIVNFLGLPIHVCDALHIAEATIT